jgi:hypothetical protein
MAGNRCCEAAGDAADCGEDLLREAGVPAGRCIWWQATADGRASVTGYRRRHTGSTEWRTINRALAAMHRSYR